MTDASGGDTTATDAGTITAVGVTPLDLPLEEPFEIALGVQETATNLLVAVETDDGVVGVGEGSPIGPVTGETQTAAIATAEAVRDLLVGEPVAAYRRLIGAVRDAIPGNPSALVAIETALLDAYCRARGLALSELFGGPPRPVETDMTLGIVPPEEARRLAAQAVAEGYTHLKVKTGADVADDVARVTAIHREVPEATLKVDANQGWTPKECVQFAEAVASEGIEVKLIEQPVPADDIERLADVTRRLSVPVAADEAVFTPEDALRVVRADAADILNIKLGKAGLLGAADIIAIAEAAGLEVMIGCMLESAIGTHTGAHVVAGSDAFGYVDLDANRLLAADVIPTEGGPTHDITGPGHGVVPDPKHLPDGIGR